MASRQRPDLYGRQSPSQAYPPPTAGPRGGPPAYPGRGSAAPYPQPPGQRAERQPREREARARNPGHQAALRGVPKYSERAAARPVEPVRLTPEEMKTNKECADFFSLIVMADRLERAWIDDVIPNAEYEAACSKLIMQFNTVRKNSRSVRDLKKFTADYHCNAAHGMQMGLGRLITGIPATMEHNVVPVSERNYEGRAKRIHECTQAFITLLDAIEIGNTTAEQLAPLARELLKSLGRVEGLEAGYQFKAQCQAWVAKIASMTAYEKLSDEELANFRMQALAGYDEYADSLQKL